MAETFTERLEEKKPKRMKLILVSLIQAKGESALVEWSDGDYLCRAYVPTSEIVEDRCPADALAAGIPYGVPWENFITVNSARAVACALRAHGFWTSLDIEQRPARAQAVISAALGVSAAHLHGLAKQYEEA